MNILCPHAYEHMVTLNIVMIIVKCAKKINWDFSNTCVCFSMYTRIHTCREREREGERFTFKTFTYVKHFIAKWTDLIWQLKYSSNFFQKKKTKKQETEWQKAFEIQNTRTVNRPRILKLKSSTCNCHVAKSLCCYSFWIIYWYVFHLIWVSWIKSSSVLHLFLISIALYYGLRSSIVS